MQLNQKFKTVFGTLPIVGMIHLAGDNPVPRALEELAIFEEEGVDGAIIENYHGSLSDVVKTISESAKLNSTIAIGVNILPNECNLAFSLAHQYGIDFIQLDHIAGRYASGELNLGDYAQCKEKCSEIIVFGGVWPKYYQPVHGSSLAADIRQGMARAEAIVVTGSGTGKETPLSKIKIFREVLGDHPLIVGAGLTPENAYQQLCLADGAIVGSCFKYDNNTQNPVERMRVADFMAVVKEARLKNLKFPRIGYILE
ncbi:MAG: BtpA/SgcQ family protein [Nanoarchaeota archaeon]|nr:BtpA/SgcQ family protein [Nanoarchaeota archaeon]